LRADWRKKTVSLIFERTPIIKLRASAVTHYTIKVLLFLSIGVINMKTILNRFLRYVKFDTQSNEGSTNHPSTPEQMEFARLLKQELKDLGLSNVTLSETGYLMGKLPANTDQNLPTVGFIAHLDTSPDVSGKNVKPLSIS